MKESTMGSSDNFIFFLVVMSIYLVKISSEKKNTK